MKKINDLEHFPVDCHMNSAGNSTVTENASMSVIYTNARTHTHKRHCNLTMISLIFMRHTNKNNEPTIQKQSTLRIFPVKGKFQPDLLDKFTWLTFLLSRACISRK